MEESQRELLAWRDKAFVSTTIDKKTKRHCFGKGIEKIQQMVPSANEDTLADKTAQALAQAWSRDESLLPDLCCKGNTEMELIFKVQVAIFLQGVHLARWIQSQGGLTMIAAIVWPHLFQRLLTSVYQEINKAHDGSGAIKLLNDIVQQYCIDYRKQQKLNHVLHRLGMTNVFLHEHVIKTDNHFHSYYWHQQDRMLHFDEDKVMLFFPLPFVLQGCSVSTIEKRKTYFRNSPNMEKRKKEWSQKVTSEECMNENQGKAISKCTLAAQNEQKTNCNNCTSVDRHMHCLSVMVRSKINGCPQVTLMLALLSLLDPFVSTKHPTSPDNVKQFIFLRQFRIDIFWFLSCALGTFYAKLDLVLACLKMARNCMDPLPGLSDRMRYALMFQNMAVEYGHWRASQLVFSNWFNQVPSCSWLYEEFVLVHMKGVFWQMENKLMEIYITQMYHEKCDKPCYDEHIRLPLLKLKNLKNIISCIAYECLAKRTIQSMFHYNLKTALRICKYFSFALKKLEYNVYNVIRNFDEELKLLGLEMQRDLDMYTSRHFVYFMNALPYYVASQQSWENLMFMALNVGKRTLQGFSLAETPRYYADQLFSLVVSMLAHNKVAPFTHIIKATLEAYEQCTAHRHHRIPLLKKLLEVYSQQERYKLNPQPCQKDSKDIHPQVSKEDSSAIGMTHQDIKKFSLTMQDGQDNFKNIDLSNDEKFCMYLKNRDELMPLWINFGLDSLRFADCL